MHNYSILGWNTDELINVLFHYRF